MKHRFGTQRLIFCMDKNRLFKFYMLVNALPALSQTALIEAINVSVPGNFLGKVIFLDM